MRPPRCCAVLVLVAALVTGCGLTPAKDAAPPDPGPAGGHACPTPPAPDGRQSSIDYLDGLTLGGRSYERVHPAPTRVEVGPVVTTTLCRLADAHDPSAQLRDRDAVLLPPGTTLHAVPGFDPGFRLLADAPDGPVLYEARHPAAGSRTGADVFPGVAPHVVALTGVSIHDGTELTRTTDPADLRDFLAGLTAAPVRLDRRDLSPDAQGFIGLVLDDGSSVQRVYHARDGVLDPGLTLPAPARRVAERLLLGRAGSGR